MKIRRTTSDEIDDVMKLSRYAYGQGTELRPGSKEVMDLTYDEYLTVEENGKVIANSRLLPFEQNTRQVWKKMGGIAEITSAPETRRQGHIRELMKYMFKEMHDDGYATSVLYPFKDEFYGRLGYVSCTPVRGMTVNLDRLRRWDLPAGHHVERMEFSQGLTHLKAIHKESVESTHGGVRRSEKRWKEMNISLSKKNSIAVAFDQEDKPRGALVYAIKGYGTYGKEDDWGTMRIREKYWLSHEARSALFHFLHMHDDQIVKIKIPVHPNEIDYHYWFANVNPPTIEARLVVYMARLIDVEKSVEGLSAACDGELTIKVKDTHCPWNSQSYRLVGGGGCLKAEALGNATSSIKMSIGGLSALVFGVMWPADLEPLGLCTGLDSKSIELLTSWFPREPPSMIEDF